MSGDKADNSHRLGDDREQGELSDSAPEVYDVIYPKQNFVVIG